MAAASVTLRVERVNASPRIRIGAYGKSRGAPARPGAPSVGGLEERPGCAGALRTLGGLEERPGCAGALRTMGGVWGAISGPPMLLRPARSVRAQERARSTGRLGRRVLPDNALPRLQGARVV